MWVALVVLIIMTLAGLAMLRQMGSGASIAGNVAFKQNATSSADAGTESALAWLVASTDAQRQADQAALGYFATWGTNVDPTTFDWAGSSVPVNLDAGVGNTAAYIIHRLCQNPGSVTAVTQTCSDADTSRGSSHLGPSYGAPVAPPLFQPYFRITTRVTGPRQTVSFTQVVVF